MDEHYRSIEGFPGYRVSRNGEVQSCRSRAARKKLADSWSLLKPIPRRGGYLTVNLGGGPRKVARYIHHLVLEAFVGPRPPGLICCHNDGDRTNNRLENLRWDTYEANEADKLRHGTRRMGSQARAKLNEEEVLEIRRLRSQGARFASIAEMFGVSHQNVKAIVYRRSWRHLP